MYSGVLSSLLVSLLALSVGGMPQPAPSFSQAIEEGATEKFVQNCVPQSNALEQTVQPICPVTLLWMVHVQERGTVIPGLIQYTYPETGVKDGLPFFGIRLFDRRQTRNYVINQYIGRPNKLRLILQPLLLGYVTDVSAWQTYLNQKEEDMREDTQKEAIWVWKFVTGAKYSFGDKPIIAGYSNAEFASSMVKYINKLTENP
ncbi:MAG: hypothetical protein M1829_002238 [Trizodia sp. TS-e1964]|nr:MAG: hypothetical protein M1829_002238 [Trizodia sp. TS-e1964]